jgi:hypothetical protein
MHEALLMHFCLVVQDDCDSRAENGGLIDYDCIKDTRLDGKVIFTGSKNFQVQKIEVLEITEQATLSGTSRAFAPRNCENRKIRKQSECQLHQFIETPVVDYPFARLKIAQH